MRTIRPLVVLSLLLALSAVDALACGDKYLSVGRGARFQRGYVSLHPVSVVVLKSKVTGRQSFLSRLKIAGHRLAVVDDVARLESMLAANKYDVILAGHESASLVEQILSKQESKPVFLPVVEDASQLNAADTRKYGCVLNPATRKKQKDFLAVLDEAVEARSRALPVVCDIAI